MSQFMCVILIAQLPLWIYITYQMWEEYFRHKKTYGVFFIANAWIISMVTLSLVGATIAKCVYKTQFHSQLVEIIHLIVSVILLITSIVMTYTIIKKFKEIK